MKTIIISLIISICVTSCTNKTNVDESLGQLPVEYQTVLDSIREHGKKEILFNCGYFLYDITGDSVPELWTYVGKCEADTELKAYTISNGSSRLIYTGPGNHVDYFICNKQLVGVMCNTGSGAVITYTYNGKRVVDFMVGFSTWNDNGEALSEPRDSVADEILKCWESDNCVDITLTQI